MFSVILNKKETSEETIFTKEKIKAIRNHPHLLGHLISKTKLSEIHSYWIRYIWDTNDNKTLQAHRNSYKTTSILLVGCIWYLLFNPNCRIGIIRKTFTDAAEIIEAINLAMERVEVQELFKAVHGEYPRFKIRRAGRTTFSFKETNTPECSLNAHGTDYGITGKHYDRIIGDDMITLRDRLSGADRKKTKEVLRELMTNIIEPGKPFSLIGTPWHRDDAWTLVSNPLCFPVDSCNILTPEQIEEKRKLTTPSLYAANYLLKHQADEDQLFSDPITDFWEYSCRSVWGHIDAAYDGNHTNGLTFMGRRKDGQLQGAGYTYPGHAEKWIKKIKARYDKYRTSGIFVEKNADKGWIASLLKKAGMNVIPYHEKDNKHMKITTHLYGAWPGMVWDKDADPDYLLQICDYMEGEEPDDCADSAASLIRQKFSEKVGADNAQW